MRTRVGCIALGTIGRPMVLNVAKAGFDLMAYNLCQAPLAELAAAKTARSTHEIGTHGKIIELI